MNSRRSLAAAMAVSAALIIVFFSPSLAQAQTSNSDASHQGQIYGNVQTANEAAFNQLRLDDVTIVVRRVKSGRTGRIVGFSAVKDGKYAIEMGSLPAGKYVVMVDPGASSYKQGERLVEYPGPQGSKRQNWTISTDQNAIPSLE